MILVTGGAGYIGSHAVLSLLLAGYDVVVLDNLCNGSELAIKRVELLSKSKVDLVVGDIRDRSLLDNIFSSYRISAVMHFAGLKSVGESVSKPLEYYENNVGGTLTLCQAMASAEVKCLVFSSSATVYGNPEQIPISESCPVGATSNPYGRSKYIAECLLSDLCLSDASWSVGVLRYFNPVGAHASGLIGEDPLMAPSNLVPVISKVAIGALDHLSIFGDDYDTIDGTGIRDYIHVIDLVRGHIKALSKLRVMTGLHCWNLGTGNGASVLEVVREFENITGVPIPYLIKSRRAGDVAVSVADPSKALEELNWVAEKDLSEMLRDAWRWQAANPEGYR